MERRISVATLSNIGAVRERNEDTIFVNSKLHLFGVCDGMGGLKYGKEAAEMVSEFFQQSNLVSEYATQASALSEEEIIKEIISDINQNISFHNYSWYVRYGCTLCGVWFINDDDAVVFSLGDSRCYILRNNIDESVLLTKDHNQAAELCAENRNDIDLDNEKGKNILTKYIGNLEDNAPFVCRVNYHIGDRFLICTDGLYNEVEKKEIDNILYNNTHRDIEDICGLLVEKAISNGGHDNISTVLINIIE